MLPENVLEAGTRSSQYAEKGVQTDLVYLPLTSNFDDVQHSPQFSPPVRSRTSTQFDSSYNHSLEYSISLDGSSPARSITNTVRAYKEKALYAHLSKPGSKKATASRMVSLPETVPSYSAKAILDKSSSRVVSMPLPKTIDSSMLSDDLDVLRDGNTFASDRMENARVRVRMHTSQMPQTPSPPSSPESVLIIADHHELAEGFLRHAQIPDSPEIHPDEEGWIRWAKSPPRPIPALHGPLSLPYARCPSGAEGTIIEEQDNLPRMIWGLEDEDKASGVPRSDTTSHARSLTPHRNASLITAASMPARPQKHKFETNSSLFGRQDKLGSGGLAHQRTTIVSERKPQIVQVQVQNDIGYPLRGQEPIDLSEIVRKEFGTAPDEYYMERDFSSNRALARAIGLQSLYTHDWQTALHTQEGLRDTRLLSTAGTLETELRGLLPPAASSPSGNALRHLGISRSPVAIEASSQLQESSQRTAPPRRLSALEIAQQYRQQQMQQLQRQSVLPTPPSSSSPIWSSSFSPYQDDLVSPELLSLSGLPKISPTILQAPSVLQSLPASRVQVRSPRDRVSHLGYAGHKVDATLLAPAAHIQENILQGYGIEPAVPGSIDVSLIPSSLAYGSNSTLLRQIQHSGHSRAQPKPSTDTPLAATISHDPSLVALDPHGAIPCRALVTPPSSISSPTRLRSITDHQTRSIPFARLIQRRLSAVPEEDGAVSPPAPQVASPLPSKHPRTRSRTSEESPANWKATPQPHFLLSPPSPLPGDTLSQSKSTEAELVLTGAEGSSWSALATVKLPGGPVKSAANGVNDGPARKSDHNRRREGAKDGPTRGNEATRGRGQKRGVRGRRGRNSDLGARNGPERIDGGLVVKS